jgi:hypothetical protein
MTRIFGLEFVGPKIYHLGSENAIDDVTFSGECIQLMYNSFPLNLLNFDNFWDPEFTLRGP